jgi:hypothetical protein
MSNRRGQKFGIQRGDRRRFPYEPRVIGGKLLMPAELQAIHRYVVKTPALEAGPFGLNSYRSFRQSVDMALKLRPTGLGSGIDKDRADYSGEWEVGRIYEKPGWAYHKMREKWGDCPQDVAARGCGGSRRPRRISCPRRQIEIILEFTVA